MTHLGGLFVVCYEKGENRVGWDGIERERNVLNMSKCVTDARPEVSSKTEHFLVSWFFIISRS